MRKQAHNILSIIPARAGSTEVKNKNVQKLDGKPLIYYTIMASLKSNITRTVVSTDDSRIAIIAKKYGAEIPFLRPSKFSTSKATSMSVILHCLNYLKENEDYFPDYVIYLQPTSPFRTYEDINSGIRKILNSNATSLVGLVNVTQHPYWMFKKNKDQKLNELIKSKNKPLRRQDLPTLFYINDALYITHASYFANASMNEPIIDLKNAIGLEMNYLHSFDINNDMDFKVAMCLKKYQRTMN